MQEAKDEPGNELAEELKQKTTTIEELLSAKQAELDRMRGELRRYEEQCAHNSFVCYIMV